MSAAKFNLRNPAVKRIMQVRMATARAGHRLLSEAPDTLSCHAKAQPLFVVQEIKEMQSERSADFIADALEVSEQHLLLLREPTHSPAMQGATTEAMLKPLTSMHCAAG